MTPEPDPPFDRGSEPRSRRWRRRPVGDPSNPFAAPPPPPLPPRPVAPGPPISKLWILNGTIGTAVLIAIVVLLLQSAPYVVFVPGSATAVEPLIGIEAIDGGELPELDDVGEHILFTTVSVEYPTGALVLRRTVDDNADIAPSAQYFGTQTEEENRRYNQALMTDSKDKATLIALETLGYDVEVTEVGAVLLDVDPTYPAADVLTPGDTIIAADGKPVRRSDDLIDVIEGHRTGDDLELTIAGVGRGEERTVRARLAPHTDDPERPQLGVSLTTRPSFTFPFEVTIDSGEVGGPSAGLAFTLALIDLLSPGELTGGRTVAVTGTIELDGGVGPVGGVRQKTEAAIRNGAEIFLVPTHEFDDATAAAGDRMDVIEVTDIDDALAALRANGGDPVEPIDRN